MLCNYRSRLAMLRVSVHPIVLLRVGELNLMVVNPEDSGRSWISDW